LIERCVQEAKKHRIYEVFVITNRDTIFHRIGFSQQLHDQKALFLRP
jgi:N-acetylglutamate synthase-like GNAT family acetyltransferase